jgi:hypothetical protein
MSTSLNLKRPEMTCETPTQYPLKVSRDLKKVTAFISPFLKQCLTNGFGKKRL